MKIKELQAGGLLGYTPSNPSALQIGNQGSSSAVSSRQNEEEGLLSKEVIKLLLEKGLSNDVDVYLSQLSDISSSISNNPRRANQLMLNQYSQVNKIILNKSALEDSINRADSNRGLNEIAITTTGHIIVENQETGRLDQVSAKLLKDNLDILRPLTNSELVQRRQTDPSLAFNTSIASVVGNGVGPDKISDYILGVASKIGQSKFTSEGYVNKKEQNIDEGIQALLSGGEDGIYKIGINLTQQGKLVEQALNYIYSVLPLNMKNFLRATSAAQGVDPEQGATQLILSMIMSTVKSVDETKVDYDSVLSKAALGEAKSGSSGEDKEGINVEQAVMIASGKGTPISYQLNAGTNYTIEVDGEYFLTPHGKKDNLAINESMSLKNLLTDTLIAGTVDPGSVYMGSQRISEGSFDRIVYNNNDGFITALIPYKMENGHKVPDFYALGELSKVKEEIKDKGAIPDIEKRKIYAAHNLLEYYNMVEVNPEAINYDVVAPFLMFSGITSNDPGIGISGFSTKDELLSVNDPYYKGVQTLIFETVMNAPAKEGGRPGDKKISQWYNWASGKEDIISGTVFIPLSNDKLSTYSSSKMFKIPKLHGFADRLMANDIYRKGKERMGPTSNNFLD